MFNRQALAHCRVGDIVLEASAIAANGEEPEDVVLGKRVAKTDRRNLNGMGHHLSVELPADLCFRVAIVMVFSEEIDAVVCITAGEVLAISGDDQLLDCVSGARIR